MSSDTDRIQEVRRVMLAAGFSGSRTQLEDHATDWVREGVSTDDIRRFARMNVWNPGERPRGWSR